MISLASREDQHRAYWDGFTMGMAVPGTPWLVRQMGMDTPRTPIVDEWHHHQTAEENFEQGDLFFMDVSTPEKKGFWMGYAAGFMSTAVFTGLLFVNAPVGFYGGGVHAAIQLSPVLAPVGGVVALNFLVDEMTTPGATVESFDVGGSSTYKVTPSLGGEGFFAWLFGW